MKNNDKRIIIVKRETRLDHVLRTQNTRGQASFYIKQLGGDFDEYQGEHERYEASLQQVRRSIEGLGLIQLLDRKYLPNFLFAPDDLVVVIGQDGLVANTLKYLDGQALIGINPDVLQYDGVLLPFVPADAAKIIGDCIAGRRAHKNVSMGKVKLQNGQELLAVNDFFIGQKTHSSARYVLKFGGLKEPQSSSGVIVSTGLGSSGWLKSIIAGATRINASIIGKPYGGKQENETLTEVDGEVYDDLDACMMSEDSIEEKYRTRNITRARKLFVREAKRGLDKGPASASFSKPLAAARISSKKSYGASELTPVLGKWDAEELIFAVREPFPANNTGTNLVFGKISRDKPLRIESLMGENGVIFSDGIESDFLDFNSGTEARISVADKKARLIV
ncbi:diacylglycerol kinase catalytic domain-containing protein [Breznakiellaceae bacterium SP9]